MISNVAHQMYLYRELDWGRKNKPIMSEGAWASALWYLEKKTSFGYWRLRELFKYEDWKNTTFEDFVFYVLRLDKEN